jgi:hypothetical protein
LKAKIVELETNGKIKKYWRLIWGNSVILRRVNSPELMQYSMRRVIWLQTPTLFWSGRGFVSLGY